jgi:hypothetical protein
MARVELQSTTLNAATYQDQGAVLELEFRSGAIYRYGGVPAPVYQGLLSADSKGRYFNQHIRNRFPYIEIDPTRRDSTHESAIHKSAE